MYNNLLGFNQFAYCYNNPINYVDYCGESPDAVVAWLSSAWWLMLIDGILPIGDMLYVGIAVLTMSALVVIGNNIKIHPIEHNGAKVETLPVQSPSYEMEKIPVISHSYKLESFPVDNNTKSIETFPVSNIDKSPITLKGKENKRLTKFRGLSDSQIIEIYKDPKTSKKEKRELQQEQKARGLRNVNKRKELY